MINQCQIKTKRVQFFHIDLLSVKMASILKVPEPVKDIFNSFPLVTYPPVEQHTSVEKEAIQDRLYSFSYDVFAGPSAHFKLGVYNVFELDDNTILATDPVCLAAELAITLKNTLKLPKLNNEKAFKKNSLFVLSHHSNCQGYLPLFIEEEGNGHKKFVKDSIGIDEVNLSRVSSSSEIMLIKLVDIAIHDYWVTSILLEIDQNLQSEIYQGYSSNKLTNKYGLYDLLSKLIKRNGFNLRNPNISQLFESEHAYGLVAYKKYIPKVQRGVDSERSRNYNEFTQAIENLKSILERKKTKFFGSDDKPDLLDVKLASYIILGNKFLKQVPFGQTITRHTTFRTLGEEVVQYCA